MKNKMLVVVDMQNDFIGGPLGSNEAISIVPKVAQRIQEAIDEDWVVRYTMDTHFDNYFNLREGRQIPIKHCVFGTEGCEIHPEILKLCRTDIDVVIPKRGFGSFGICRDWTDEEPDMIDEIEICGLCTDLCIISNAIILMNQYPDAEIVINADCCAGTTPEKHENALKAMEALYMKIKRGE